MPTRPSLSKIAAMIALALLTAACSGPDTAAPATTKPAADAITDRHFRATLGDRVGGRDRKSTRLNSSH